MALKILSLGQDLGTIPTSSESQGSSDQANPTAVHASQAPDTPVTEGLLSPQVTQPSWPAKVAANCSEPNQPSQFDVAIPAPIGNLAR